MKSVCFFTFDLGTGGTEKVVIYLANYLVTKGRDVTLLTVFDKNDLEHLISPKVKIACLHKNKIRNAIPALIKFIRTHEIDNFISNVWPLTVMSSLVRLFAPRTKLLFIEHCNLSEEFKKRSSFFKLFQKISIKIFYKFAHEVITVSDGVKQDLLTKGVKSSKLSVIYNPIASSRNHLELDKSAEIKKWLDSEKKKLISVGKLKKQKNFPNLVKAISSFKKNYSIDVKVLILGDGEERGQIESTINEEGLQGDILLPGWAKNPIPYLEKADLFILSSDFEGFGLVIAEALSVGLNVVATDCKSGPKEILKDGEVGFLCKVNDELDLAKSINQALSYPIQKEKLINRSKDFSINHIGRLYEEKLN